MSTNPGTESSSSLGELIKGVGVKFNGMKKKKTVKKKKTNKGKKAYYSFD